MAGLGLLLGIVGAVGCALTFTGIVPAFSRLPVPSAAWPVAAVAGFVLYFLTRRPAD
jgi:hypothetical protein